MEQERTLPKYTIAGTAFIVDVERDELRQLDRPDNTIPFNEMAYSKSGYQFDYDSRTKNLPESFTSDYETIYLPNLTELDPVGMALKYGKAETELIGKTDVEVIIDQELLASRESGKLPVIEIAGHPFYVDIRIDLLRPKDDFSTMGISFTEIDDYFIETNHYRFPYDPETHCFKQLDYENIKTIPENIIVVEIPSQQQLDPVTFARLHGINPDHVLRQNPLQMQMRANVVPWDDTPIKEIIARNFKRDLENGKIDKAAKPGRRKGRGI